MYSRARHACNEKAFEIETTAEWDFHKNPIPR
jgi:hypothetical protein